MELYEAINKRKTTREFLDTEVDFAVIKRILKAGNKAPTWDHKNVRLRYAQTIFYAERSTLCNHSII